MSDIFRRMTRLARTQAMLARVLDARIAGLQKELSRTEEVRKDTLAALDQIADPVLISAIPVVRRLSALREAEQRTEKAIAELSHRQRVEKSRHKKLQDIAKNLQDSNMRKAFERSLVDDLPWSKATGKDGVIE